MPDSNKARKLDVIDYKVILGCADCIHSVFRTGHSFGSCQLHLYDHEKHGTRKLSVHQSGRCAALSPKAKTISQLQQSGFDRLRRWA